jgi:hypothetical protein
LPRAQEQRLLDVLVANSSPPPQPQRRQLSMSDEALIIRGGACPALQHLRQIGAEQIASLLQLGGVPLRAIAIELLLPFHHVGLAPVFLD